MARALDFKVEKGAGRGKCPPGRLGDFKARLKKVRAEQGI